MCNNYGRPGVHARLDFLRAMSYFAWSHEYCALRCRCFDSARQHRSGADCKRRTVLVDASTAKPRQEATTTTPQRPAQAFNGHHRARSAERSCAGSSVTICSHGSSASSSSSPTSSSSSTSSSTSSSSQSQGQSRILCRVRSSSSGSAEGREAGPSICPAEQGPSRGRWRWQTSSAALEGIRAGAAADIAQCSRVCCAGGRLAGSHRPGR